MIQVREKHWNILIVFKRTDTLQIYVCLHSGFNVLRFLLWFCVYEPNCVVHTVPGTKKWMLPCLIYFDMKEYTLTAPQVIVT